MQSVTLFSIYALTLLNLYVWMIWPEFLYTTMWKWDIFVTFLFAPLIYSQREKK